MSTTTIKVKILTDCEFCDGKAYIPLGEAYDSNGGIYTRYIPCSYCEGSGLRTKYINLVDFIRLIESVDICQPDYKDMAEEEPLSQYIDNLEFAGIKIKENTECQTIMAQPHLQNHQQAGILVL